mmetsp:Transcript_33126/g.77520  ORF Transcript_33126/g.77520 Transcript_33126/m.77520 type:complete len:481 (-) Transcript_33126:18-1460(-)
MLGKQLQSVAPNRRQEGARAALVTLSAINLLNFADRYVPSAVKTLLQEELKLSDAETAYPTTAMLGVYMVSAVIFGVMADRQIMDRRLLLAMGVALWSVATMLAGVAQDLQQLILFRSLVGVGEAAYMTIVPPMLSDFYPRSERNAAYAIFNVTMPLGGALGFVLAGIVGSMLGWRAAFFICGAPGLLVALLILRLNDPPRGINDRETPEGAIPLTDESGGELDREAENLNASYDGAWSSAKAILTNSRYMVATFGLIAQSFAIGAFAEWYDTLLVREGVATIGQAGMILGAATAFGGIYGTIAGSKVAQKYEGRWRSAYFLVPAIFTVPAFLLALAATSFVHKPSIAYTSIIFTEICTFTATAPLNTVSISIMPVALRSRSAGLQIFLIHVLGDVLSPPLVGLISDHTGSLQLALQVVCFAFLISGAWWYFGARCLEPLPTFSKEKGSDAAAEASSVGLRDLLCSGDSGEVRTGRDSDL